MSVQPTSTSLYQQLTRPSSLAPQHQHEEIDQKSRVADAASATPLYYGGPVNTTTMNEANQKLQAQIKGITGPKLDQIRRIESIISHSALGQVDRKSYPSIHTPMTAASPPSQSATRPLTAATAIKATNATEVTAQRVMRIPILSNLLDKLFKRLNDLIQNAEIAGHALIIELGREVAIALENFKNAYVEMLNLTKDAINELANKLFTRLENMIDGLENWADNTLEVFKRDLIEFLLLLPFTDKHTQLTSVSPYYVVLSSDEPNPTVTFKGIFKYADASGYKPTLTFGNTSCELSDNGTQQLGFKVPVSEIISDKTISLTKSSAPIGILSAPWDNGYWWWCGIGWLGFWRWHYEKVEATFKIPLTVLPPSPGIIDVEFIKKTEIISKSFTTETVTATNVPYEGRTCITKPAPGKIVPGSLVLRITNVPGGEHSIRNYWIEGDNKIAVHVDCAINCTIKFHVECRVLQEVPSTQKPRQQFIILNWGGSAIAEPKKGELTKITFVDFNGTTNVFAEPFKNDNRYLKIYETALGYRLFATLPK